MDNEMMDKDFAKNMEFMESIKDDLVQVFNHNRLIDFIKDLDLSGRILDIGERNPLTKKIENHYHIKIDSTSSDLDRWLSCPRSKYDLIIFNQVIEHLFNPLLCLENIKDVMNVDSILIIGTPIKPGFITTCKGHFHELDDYRFKKLIERAGLEIINWQKFYTYKNIVWQGFTGLRPFIKMFYKRHSYVKCIKKQSFDE